MLREIHLASFKCFENLNLPLAPLTLLTGVNGGGKSSVMQALVLLAQTIRLREWGTALLLAGPDLALGSVADVMNQNASRRVLSLGLVSDEQEITWQFEAEDRRALTMNLSGIQVDGEQYALEKNIRWLMPLDLANSSPIIRALRHLSWITAERTGPRELLPLADAVEHLQVGRHGEMAAGMLYWREDEPVRPDLCLPDVPNTLFHQVRAYMRQFFPGCDFKVSPIDGASAISLRLRSDPRSDFQRPQNVGFGLTQLFPILVAVLAARPGDVLLIENPEVHLHPRAQQEIGCLLAKAATSGVQVIMESHSDHVLNGVRLGVKQEIIAAQNVRVHFFAPQPGQAVKAISPTIDAHGRLDQWPDGFFDQFDHALSELL